MVLTAILAAFLSVVGGDRLEIRLREPSWTESAVSVSGRLLILAEIQPADALDDVWLEVQSPSAEEWQRQPIPLSRRIRLSPQRIVVAPIFEPRTLPGVHPGDLLRVRIAAAGSAGVRAWSGSIEIRLHPPDEREALLLSRLDQARGTLQDVLERVEAEHQLLFRIEQYSREMDILEVGVAVELQSLEPERAARPDQFLRLGADLLVALDEGCTDEQIHSRREVRWRRTVVGVLLGMDDANSPWSLLQENLARARRAKTAEERRAALRSGLSASFRLINRLQGLLSEIEVWHANLELRREARSLLRSQREVTEGLLEER